MNPTPHGLAAVTATPLGTPAVIGSPSRPQGWTAALRRQFELRTWVLVTLTIPLALATAATTVESIEEHQRVEAQDRALDEASEFAQALVIPLRGAEAVPTAARLREMEDRMQRLAHLASTERTVTHLRLVAPAAVEVVTRAAVGDRAGTAVCLAALRWPNATVATAAAAGTPAGAADAGRPSWKGPYCFVEGGAVVR